MRQRTNEGNFNRGMDVAGGMMDATTSAYGAAGGNTNQWRRGLSGVGHSIDEGYEVAKDYIPFGKMGRGPT